MSFDNDRRGPMDFLDDNGCWTCDGYRLLTRRPNGLQRCDHVLAHPRFVQGNDVWHSDFTKIASLANLIDNHLIAQSAARHRNHVLERDSRLQSDGLLLSSVLLLLGPIVGGALLRNLSFFVGCIAQQASRHSTHHSADHSTSSSLAAVVADYRTSGGASKPTPGSTALFVVLRRRETWSA